MAIAVPQIHPVAHLPLILGYTAPGVALSSLVFSRLTRRMCSRLGVGSRPWSSRYWMEIMPCIRWRDGWKSWVGWYCSSQG